MSVPHIQRYTTGSTQASVCVLAMVLYTLDYDTDIDDIRSLYVVSGP